MSVSLFQNEQDFQEYENKLSSSKKIIVFLGNGANGKSVLARKIVKKIQKNMKCRARTKSNMKTGKTEQLKLVTKKSFLLQTKMISKNIYQKM